MAKPTNGNVAEAFGELAPKAKVAAEAPRRNLGARRLQHAPTADFRPNGRLVRMIAGLSDIGQSNGAFARRFLADEGIACVAESLGGTSARRIRFWPVSGRARQILLASSPVLAQPVPPRRRPATWSCSSATGCFQRSLTSCAKGSRHGIPERPMQAAKNVLTRKLQRGGVARSPLPDTEFIGQTFARQIEKGLRPLVKTLTSAMVLECKVVKVADAVRDIAVPTMLGLIELDNAKIQGLLNIDTEFAFHLIDLMLGGDPAAAPVPTPRSFTEIDMALCGIAQECLLTALDEALAASFGRPLTRPLQIVAQRQDVTQIRFAAEHMDVLVYNIALDIGPAARSGRMQVVLPLAMLDTICAILKEEAAKSPKEEPWDLWKEGMRHAALRAPVVLDAVLHQRRMTISEVMALRVGDVLDLPAAAVNEVQFLVAQQGGARAKIAAGRLGAYLGAKVVKLDAPIDPRARDHIRQIWTPASASAEAPAAVGPQSRRSVVVAGAAGASATPSSLEPTSDLL